MKPARSLAAALLFVLMTPVVSNAGHAGPWRRVGDLPTARAGAASAVLPDGRMLVVGGLTPDVVATAATFDPATDSWTTARPMSTPRVGHAAATLPDGRVLVAGGAYRNQFLSSAEIYDPATDTWTPTGSLVVARRGLRLTATPDGRIIVTGGLAASQCPGSYPETRVERYDPPTGTFELWGGLRQRHADHAATLLPSGKIFIYGGYSLEQDGSARFGSNVPEIYDPALGSISKEGLTRVGGAIGATASVLPDGRVLVVGGCCIRASTPNVTESSNEELGADRAWIYDPARDIWTATMPMLAARAWHTATTLPNGQVLVVGGRAIHPGTFSVGTRLETALAITEIYDPATNAWMNAGALAEARADHAVLRVPDGVVVAGGTGETWRELTSTERFATGGAASPCCPAVHGPANGTPMIATPTADPNPPTAFWTVKGSLGTARRDGLTVRLANGRILLAGGEGAFGPGHTVEIYDPALGTWRNARAMAAQRAGFTLTGLADGRVLAVGGYVGNNPSATAEIYDPQSDTWTPTAWMETSRQNHTAALLHDGRVLVAGGTTRTSSWCTQPVAAAEIYDPATNAWSRARDMTVTRQYASMVTLADGQVAIVGGGNGSAAEIYDPTRNLWRLSRPMLEGRRRYGLTATALADGRLLVVGGDAIEASAVVTTIPIRPMDAEILDPGTMTWTLTAPMQVPRSMHAATALPDGLVVVTGGLTRSPTLGEEMVEETEVFDPRDGRWTTVAPLPRPRFRHAAIALADGRVLAAGGTTTYGFGWNTEKWAEELTVTRG